MAWDGWRKTKSESLRDASSPGVNV
ncbi:hypothetical protein [Polaromonas sp.]|uniref:Uncharacterized protein n=1 Tax=Polaromonas aquatica TaxID=332657 RepID=A0ABW1TV10_9BURK